MNDVHLLTLPTKMTHLGDVVHLVDVHMVTLSIYLVNVLLVTLPIWWTYLW